LADIDDDTRARLAAVLDPGLLPVNPLDAWGTGADYERVFLECLEALASDRDTGALALAVDLSGEDLEAGYESVAIEASRRTRKPVAVICNLPTAVHPAAASRLRAAGVPVLEGTQPALVAVRGLLFLRDVRAMKQVIRTDPVADGVRATWRTRLGSPEPWPELEALALLAD